MFETLPSQTRTTSTALFFRLKFTKHSSASKLVAWVFELD